MKTLQYKRGEVSYGVRTMRRCVILISGLCTGFSILWFLCAQMTAAYFSAETVLSVTPVLEQTWEDALQFPFEIPGTTLIAEQIVSYDGQFSEEGSTSDVVNVAALLLYNYGQQGIAQTQIRLKAGQVWFEFSADTIPAGGRILVPEKNGKEFGPQKFSSCKGSQQADGTDWENTDRIRLEYPDMGTVVVTNLTDRTLSGICLYYKSYYEDGDFYVGGKTVAYYIEALAPNEYIQIYPYNYALGYSRFARIEIEEP